jgi:hypothetical protein
MASMFGSMSFSKHQFSIFIQAVLVLALAWFSWLMLRITLEYVPPRDDAGFLQIKQQYLGILPWKAAFWTHVFTSMLTLLAGFTQFFPGLLRRVPRMHRWMGKFYVLNVCLVTGPASLVMAFYANGGVSSRIAFTVLACGWIVTTAMGWRSAILRHWESHRAWMIRSYALTLSAITLRAWKWLLVMIFDPRPMDVYRLVAWLGFVPNLLMAEWLIHRRHEKF